MDVPVVAAAWLKRHIREKNARLRRIRQRIEIARADEILGVGAVFRARPKTFAASKVVLSWIFMENSSLEMVALVIFFHCTPARSFLSNSQL